MHSTKSIADVPCVNLLYSQDHKELQLGVETTDELDSWKASFLRAGVYPEKEKDSNDTEEVGTNRTGVAPRLQRINNYW